MNHSIALSLKKFLLRCCFVWPRSWLRNIGIFYRYEEVECSKKLVFPPDALPAYVAEVFRWAVDLMQSSHEDICSNKGNSYHYLGLLTES